MPTLCQHPKFGEFFEFCAALIIPLKGFSQRKLQKFFPVRLSNVPPSPATFTKCGFCKVCGYQYLALVWTRQERLKHRRAPPRQIAYCVVGRQPVARLREAEVTSRRSPKTTRLSKWPRRPVRIVEGSQPLDRFGASTAVRHRRQRFSSLTRRINALLFHWLTTQTAGNRQCIH